jgi:hypothetical protein
MGLPLALASTPARSCISSHRSLVPFAPRAGRRFLASSIGLGERLAGGIFFFSFSLFSFFGA